MMTRIIV
ncbi:hypothetical protein E2C01_049168 [Portunus trituberculatus]|nr:hypothetical protein [Portunus trituberculatus]